MKKLNYSFYEFSPKRYSLSVSICRYLCIGISFNGKYHYWTYFLSNPKKDIEMSEYSRDQSHRWKTSWLGWSFGINDK
jgi:hypothetical protein